MSRATAFHSFTIGAQPTEHSRRAPRTTTESNWLPELDESESSDSDSDFSDSGYDSGSRGPHRHPKRPPVSIRSPALRATKSGVRKQWNPFDPNDDLLNHMPAHMQPRLQRNRIARPAMVVSQAPNTIPSRLSSLGRRFVRIPEGCLELCEAFVSDHLEILGEDTAPYVAEAVSSLHQGDRKHASSCLEKSLILSKCSAEGYCNFFGDLVQPDRRSKFKDDVEIALGFLKELDPKDEAASLGRQRAAQEVDQTLEANSARVVDSSISMAPARDELPVFVPEVYPLEETEERGSKTKDEIEAADTTKPTIIVQDFAQVGERQLDGYTQAVLEVPKEDPSPELKPDAQNSSSLSQTSLVEEVSLASGPCLIDKSDETSILVNESRDEKKKKQPGPDQNWDEIKRLRAIIQNWSIEDAQMEARRQEVEAREAQVKIDQDQVDRARERYRQLEWELNEKAERMQVDAKIKTAALDSQLTILEGFSEHFGGRHIAGALMVSLTVYGVWRFWSR